MCEPVPYAVPVPEEAARPGYRWTRRRKLAVVAAISGGWLDGELALRAYRLSAEEYAGWVRLQETSGSGFPETSRRRGCQSCGPEVMR